MHPTYDVVPKDSTDLSTIHGHFRCLVAQSIVKRSGCGCVTNVGGCVHVGTIGAQARKKNSCIDHETMRSVAKTVRAATSTIYWQGGESHEALMRPLARATLLLLPTSRSTPDAKTPLVRKEPLPKGVRKGDQFTFQKE